MDKEFTLVTGDEATDRWRLVESQPNPGPNETDPAREKEDPAPAKRGDDERDERRGDHGADAGARVEDAEGQRSLARREPFGYRFA